MQKKKRKKKKTVENKEGLNEFIVVQNVKNKTWEKSNDNKLIKQANTFIKVGRKIMSMYDEKWEKEKRWWWGKSMNKRLIVLNRIYILFYFLKQNNIKFIDSFVQKI